MGASAHRPPERMRGPLAGGRRQPPDGAWVPKGGQCSVRRAVTHATRHLALGSEGPVAIRILTLTVVLGGDWTRPARLAVNRRWAELTTLQRCMTISRVYPCEALLERLAEPCEDVPPARRAFVPAAHARGCPRRLARQRERTADAPHSRNSVMRGATRAQRHQGFFRNGSVARGVL
jgi:hypothetical protein